MTHDTWRDQLSALLDGELDGAARARVTAHLADCADCRACLAELTALHELLGGMEELEPPAALAERVMARVRAERMARRVPGRGWHGWAAAAACAAVALLALNGLPRMGGAGAPTSAAQETASAGAETEEAPAGRELLLESKTLALADGGASAQSAPDTLTNDAAPAAAPEADYGGAVNTAEDAADVRGTLAGAGAAAWLAEHGWQGESGDWYVAAAELRALPEGVALDAPLPDGYDGAVRVTSVEPPDGALTLAGAGAADWLAEHGEPTGDGRWRVSTEALAALPDTLDLTGIQRPTDGAVLVTPAETEAAP